MRLRDLDAEFIGNANPTTRGWNMQDSLPGAQGVMFQCPKCAEGKEAGQEDGRRFFRGAHYIMVCFSNPIGAPVAPVEFDDNPRWVMSGSSLDDLTLMPSINCDIPWKDDAGVEHPSSCKFHGWIKNGDAA